MSDEVHDMCDDDDDDKREMTMTKMWMRRMRSWIHHFWPYLDTCQEMNGPQKTDSLQDNLARINSVGVSKCVNVTSLNE